MRDRFVVAAALAAMLVLGGCNSDAGDTQTEDGGSQPAAGASAEFEKKLAKYKSVRLTADLSDLTDKQREMISLMIHIGDDLGLYEAMAGKDSVDAGSLANSTGLNERWLKE